METASLAAVEPPDITYTLRAHKKLVEAKALSALQLEAVVYACQRHQQARGRLGGGGGSMCVRVLGRGGQGGEELVCKAWAA